MWIRGGMDDQEIIGSSNLLEMNQKSVAPLMDHGNKEYLLELAMAKAVRVEDDVDFTKPCCVKPLNGSKGKDVQIWMPKSDGTRDASCEGGATKSQVVRAISANRCIAQPFIPTGIDTIDGKNYHKLMRLFAVMNENMEYEIIPSPYVMRPNVKIHGSSDAINGLITFSD
ncbi:MAG: hypothetical protein U0525_02835 [Patescibacteria group bacterium]